MSKTIRYSLTYLGIIEDVPDNATKEDIIKAIEEDWDSSEHDLGYFNDVEYEVE